MASGAKGWGAKRLGGNGKCYSFEGTAVSFRIFVVEGSNEDIRYWLDEVQLYVMLHRPLHSTILKRHNQIILRQVSKTLSHRNRTREK